MQIDREEENILDPLIRRWITAFNAHDIAKIVSLYKDDAELFDSGMPRPRHGRAEIERWFDWRFVSTPITYTPIAQDIAHDGQVIVTWIARGSGPRFVSWLGGKFEVEGKSYFTLKDELIAKQHGVYDHLAVLKQIVPLFKWLPNRFATGVYRIYLWRGKQ